MFCCFCSLLYLILTVFSTVQYTEYMYSIQYIGHARDVHGNTAISKYVHFRLQIYTVHIQNTITFQTFSMTFRSIFIFSQFLIWSPQLIRAVKYEGTVYWVYSYIVLLTSTVLRVHSLSFSRKLWFWNYYNCFHYSCPYECSEVF